MPGAYNTSASLATISTPQLSDVIGVPKSKPDAVHISSSTDTSTSDGQVIAGNSVSFTVTSCSQVFILPLMSVMVHVTMVSPDIYGSTASFSTLNTPQLSLLTGVPSSTMLAVQMPSSVETTTLSGQAIKGSSSSVTVTSCSQVFSLPFTSVTSQVTVLAPNAKVSGASFTTL